AGSVMAGEEGVVLEGFDAVASKWPQALLILAPRKPARFDAAAELLQQSGHSVLRRSALHLNGASPAAAIGGPSDAGSNAAANAAPILLLDSIGELAAV